MEMPLPSTSEPRQQLFLRALSTLAPLTGLLAALGNLAAFILLQRWQLLALAILCVVTSGLFALSHLWLERQRQEIAAVWMSIIGVVFLAGVATLFSGVLALLLVLAWAVPGAVFVLGLPPRSRRRPWMWLGSLIGSAWIWVVEYFPPFERLFLPQAAIMRWLAPLVILLSGFLLAGTLPLAGYPAPLRKRAILVALLALGTPLLAFVSAVIVGGSGSRQALFCLAIIIALAGLGPALLGAHALARSLLSPLQMLLTTLQTTTPDQPLSVLPVPGKDEIGVLVSAFHQFLDIWRSRLGELQNLIGAQQKQLERNAVQSHTLVEIAKRLASAQNEQEALDQTAHFIRDSFELYHAGVFLGEEDGEYAVLRAAGDEGGRLMVANNYRIKVGEGDLVGWVADSGEMRIIPNVSAEPSYVPRPLLPYTLSQVALPLRLGRRILGVLDLHSDKENAFDSQDLTTLQAIADMVALAVERVRLQRDLQRGTVEMESLLQQLTGRSWRTYLQRAWKVQGYRYAGLAPEPLEAPAEEALEALRRGRTVVTKGENQSLLAVPIKLRGQMLGVLSLRYGTSEAPAEMIALVETVADRLALALENARLIEDAQRLAARERLIGEAGARMRATLDLETVLQAAVREFQQSLELKEAEIRIQLVEQSEEAKV